MTVYQVLVPLVGVFGGLTILFLVSFIVVPYRQRDEATTYASELSHQIEQKKVDEDVLNILGYLLTDGRSISYEKPHSDEEFFQWKERFSKWLHELNEAITGHFSEVEWRLVSDFGGRVSVSYGNRFSPEHNSALQNLNQMLDNLTALIDRHIIKSS